MTTKQHSGKLMNAAFIGVAVLGVAGIAYELFFQNKAAGKSVAKVLGLGGSTGSNTNATSGFPLQTGVNNNYVLQLQQALISAYGPSALPQYGADGKFGTETLGALQNYVGVSSISNIDQFDSIVATLNNTALSNQSSGSTSQETGISPANVPAPPDPNAPDSETTDLFGTNIGY